MGKESKIGWCDGTWNPWRGCKKVSPGCDNCYMFREQKRYGNDPSIIMRAAKKTFDAPLKYGDPIKIFTCSWSDFFIEEADCPTDGYDKVGRGWRDDAWDIIKATPHLTYLILTKRPENVPPRLPDDWCEEKYSHVWFGVTVENQEQADKRLPIIILLKVFNPWLKIFVSVEPMIGPIDLELWLGHPTLGVDWVICGGESGPDARMIDPEWARTIRDQCKDGGVPFFFKQMSKNEPIPDDLQIQEVPE